MKLKAGDRLHSAVSDTEVIVIRAGDEDVTVTCGGVPVRSGDEAGSVTETEKVLPGEEGPVLLGKRYVDESGAIELLCTKPGDGALAVDGRPLQLKSAQPLPSSD